MVLQVLGEDRDNSDGSDRQGAILASRIGETVLLHHEPETRAHPPLLIVTNRSGVQLGHIREPEASEIIAAMGGGMRVTATVQAVLEFPRSRAPQRLVIRISAKAAG
ncbi:hypothetical protein [Flavisphingomonas formosensis]|uniref:hypothetical protein n=1 Tax=Flavisphingomonas formosensis TaxID=861534 RepID=UPI0012F71387|nr:hypothetical protein [Sphingomonas formosensis]